MKRHGINRDNVKALALIETGLPYSFPYTNIRTEGLFESGEHYRFEIDEFIVTMKAPSPQYSYQWILPYLDTRNPDPEVVEEYLKKEYPGTPGAKRLLDIANRQDGYHRGVRQKWYVPNGGFRMTYRMLDTEEQEVFSTPEKLQALSERALPRRKVPSGKVPRNKEEAMNEIRMEKEQEKIIIEQRFFNKDYYSHKSYDSVICVINGRYWIRRTFNSNEQSYNPNRWNYIYMTTLSPDRVLRIIFEVPNYDTDTDRFMFSADSRQKAFADIEEMVASIRVAKIKDDGSPDPFVI